MNQNVSKVVRQIIEARDLLEKPRRQLSDLCKWSADDYIAEPLNLEAEVFVNIEDAYALLGEVLTEILQDDAV